MPSKIEELHPLSQGQILSPESNAVYSVSLISDS